MDGAEVKRLEDVAKDKRQKAKKRRISVEEKRLRKIYENIAEDQKGIADGLIRRAAYMRVTLEDYEIDLDEKGYVEQFTQSEKTAAYERERPVARLYNTMNRNYQQIVKQLSDMLPKGDGEGDKTPKQDGFDEFMNRR
ncbi:MAG: hypothetical protein P0Y55_12120 [Candidatus Cohnella colombiensis]|uniref:Terminase n=1 Tax=Candidatus Cohnella colombiensis TaxID=3121368 RepID=A0AA95F238_9BACL|nr:MAG: hypothetical protein P0Y55_12120 [Cohnella sp.]